MSNTPSPMISLYAPDGTLGEVPYEHLHDALQAGAKMAVQMKAPDGTAGYVPADKVQDARKAGGQVVPLEVAGPALPEKEGFWNAAGSTLKGMIRLPSGQNPYPGMGQEEKAAAAGEAHEQDVARQQAGYSPTYRVAAPLAQAVGADVPGMERAAAAGDPSGVLGHTVGSIAPIAAAELAHQAIPPAVSGIRSSIGEAIHTPEGALTPGAEALIHPTKLAEYAVNKMFPESPATIAAREDFLNAKTITDAHEAAIKENAIKDARAARVQAQQQKAEAAKNAAPTYTPPAHTEIPLGSPEYPGQNMPIPLKLTAAQQELLRPAPPSNTAQVPVPSKGIRIYGPESPAPSINKTYVSYSGDALVEMAKKGDINAIRELIRNPRGIDINNIPGVRYLIEQGRKGEVYGGPES
jgi:hypothetical protein